MVYMVYMVNIEGIKLLGGVVASFSGFPITAS